MTDNVIRNHLRHKYAVAIFAGESASRFICFDVDDGQKQTVHGVVHALAELGFPRDRIYVSSSGGKGYHVEMFFTRPVYTWKLKEVYRRVIRITGFDKRRVEFRPTNGTPSNCRCPSTRAQAMSVGLFYRIHSNLLSALNTCWEIQQIPAIGVIALCPMTLILNALTAIRRKKELCWRRLAPAQPDAEYRRLYEADRSVQGNDRKSDVVLV